MGNKVGWIVAGALLAVVAVVFLLWVVFPQPSEPTPATRGVGALDLMAVNVPLKDVVGSEPAGEGNAADDYHKAVELYQAHADEIDKALEGDNLPGMMLVETLKEIHQLVAAGATKRSMQYTLVYEPRQMEVRFSWQPDPADALADVAEALGLLARQQASKGNHAQAEATLQSALVLGWHMAEARERPYMVLRGFDAQGQSLVRLLDVYKAWGPERADRQAVAERYLQSLRRVSERYEAKTRLFRSLPPNPGDIFNIIEHDGDRSCRVQGLLVLGIVKFAVSGRGDLRYAGKLMDRFAASRDPLEAGAAKAAKDLTREQYRALGTNY